jgi:predicted nucleic acid-binding protein
VIALDANVLARYLLGDDPAQSRAARLLLEDEDEEYFIPITVTLELAWVLRSIAAPRSDVIESLRRLLSLRNVRPQLAEAVFSALHWADGGMEIADAMHLALSGRTERFLTFDRALVKQASRAGAQPAVAVAQTPR